MHKIRIVGVPMDLGQQRRGVDMGPSAVRYAGLYERLQRLGHEVEDVGNVSVPVRDEAIVRAENWIESNGGGLRHLTAVIEACTAIYAMAQECANTPEIPIFLGGDHSIAIGTVGGSASSGPLGLLWVDAHGDYNTPDITPSGNIHGMPVTGGLTFREAHLLMEILAESRKVASLDVVEINPILDDGNRTAELAVELIASIFGQKIL